MRLVFDLDGCVVDTFEAHRAAYAEAGFPDYGKIHYHGGSSKWATVEQRQRKGEVFKKHLKEHGKLLLHGTIALEKKAQNHDVVIVSACSSETKYAVLAVFPQLREIQIYSGMSQDEKIQFLKKRNSGIYYDDWDEMVYRVRMETRWQPILVSQS